MGPLFLNTRVSRSFSVLVYFRNRELAWRAMIMELTIAACVVVVLFFSFYALALVLHACASLEREDDVGSPDSSASESGEQWTAEDDARNLQEGRRSRVCRCGLCMSTARKRGMRCE